MQFYVPKYFIYFLFIVKNEILSSRNIAFPSWSAVILFFTIFTIFKNSGRIKRIIFSSWLKKTISISFLNSGHCILIIYSKECNLMFQNIWFTSLFIVKNEILSSKILHFLRDHRSFYSLLFLRYLKTADVSNESYFLLDWKKKFHFLPELRSLYSYYL